MKNIKILVLFYFIGISSLYAQFENPVSWKYSIQKASDSVYKVTYNAIIKEPWHMYAMKLDGEGPIPTTFNTEEGTGFQSIGEIIELTKPLLKFDPGFRFNVGMYSKNAAFSQEFKVISKNDITVTTSVEFQCCNDETCLPPFTETFKIPLPGIERKFIQKEINLPGNTSEIQSDTFSSRGKYDSSLSNKTLKDEIIKSGLTVDSVSPEKDQSLFLFLVIAFLAGLAAIITPCVFPMIPMTISFFLRGSENRAMAVLKGLVFGFSMIMVYTGLGIVVSMTGIDANIGNMLSTHWIPNLIFFLFFMIFAVSFLGLFDLVLPSGLVNKADKQADRGGIGGAFFMGVTTVLVSFSCTGPIVGSLLIEAAGGEVLKPVLGMFFFSLAFALPFTLLAIFPSLLKNLPKTGGWLNSVKVILGFFVLAFGMKFLSNMDQSYHLGIFTREIYLSIWFVLSVLLGFYLLGKIKLPHDNDLPFIGVPRFILAIISFTFAMYLFTGILGADLNNISSLIPPKSAQKFSFINSPSQQLISPSQKNWCGPGKYDDIFELSNGLKGYFNIEDGFACAKQLNKPIFLDFTGHSCSNCKQMESLVWPDPLVLSKLQNDFVIISLYTDDKTKLQENDWVIRSDGKILKSIGDVNKYFEMDKFNTIATPLYAILDLEGNLLVPQRFKDLDVKSFSSFLQNGIDAFESIK